MHYQPYVPDTMTHAGFEEIETYFGIVADVWDGLLLIEACRRGVLPLVKQRLDHISRKRIRCGSIFIWEETSTKLRRWTDGRSWSTSRMSGHFQIYREKEMRTGQLKPPEELVNPDLLQKKILTVKTVDGLVYRLVSYYTLTASRNGSLSAPATDPALEAIAQELGVGTPLTFPSVIADTYVVEAPYQPPSSATHSPVSRAYYLEDGHSQYAYHPSSPIPQGKPFSVNDVYGGRSFSSGGYDRREEYPPHPPLWQGSEYRASMATVTNRLAPLQREAPTSSDRSPQGFHQLMHSNPRPMTVPQIRVEERTWAEGYRRSMGPSLPLPPPPLSSTASSYSSYPGSPSSPRPRSVRGTWEPDNQYWVRSPEPMLSPMAPPTTPSLRRDSERDLLPALPPLSRHDRFYDDDPPRRGYLAARGTTMDVSSSPMGNSGMDAAEHRSGSPSYDMQRRNRPYPRDRSRGSSPAIPAIVLPASPSRYSLSSSRGDRDEAWRGHSKVNTWEQEHGKRAMDMDMDVDDDHWARKEAVSESDYRRRYHHHYRDGEEEAKEKKNEANEEQGSSPSLSPRSARLYRQGPLLSPVHQYRPSTHHQLVHPAHADESHTNSPTAAPRDRDGNAAPFVLRDKTDAAYVRLLDAQAFSRP